MSESRLIRPRLVLGAALWLAALVFATLVLSLAPPGARAGHGGQPGGQIEHLTFIYHGPGGVDATLTGSAPGDAGLGVANPLSDGESFTLNANNGPTNTITLTVGSDAFTLHLSCSLQVNPGLFFGPGTHNIVVSGVEPSLEVLFLTLGNDAASNDGCSGAGPTPTPTPSPSPTPTLTPSPSPTPEPTPPPPPVEPASLTVVKIGGDEGVSYDFELTHGQLDNVSTFSLESGESTTMILFLAADWNVVELNAPAGAVFSGTCQGDNVLPADSFTCTVTNPVTPPPVILGSSASITKVLTSADPARVGEQVTFQVTLTVTSDEALSDVELVDTFENGFLRYVGSSPAGCVLIAGQPDSSHDLVACDIGNVEAGTHAFTFDFTFDAIASTLPDVTVNTVVAAVDGDEVGPATAEIEIVEVLSAQLPPAGDGSLTASGGATAWWLLLLGFAVLSGTGSLVIASSIRR